MKVRQPTLFVVRKLFALEFLCDMQDETIDLCITDPPWDNLEKHRAVGSTTRLSKSKGSNMEWFPVLGIDVLKDVFVEIYRVLKSNSHFYLFTNYETMWEVKSICTDIGFKFWRPIVWDKGRIGMGYHYRGRVEYVLFFEKGKRKLNDWGSAVDLIKANVGRGGYPTQKPTSIIQEFIERSSSEGDLVLDPFMGSGSTGVAALSIGRRFIGCDIEERAMITATERLRSDA